METFRIARRPVTVDDFAAFVEATGHVTTAERVGRSWVWVGGKDDIRPANDKLWWEVEGASWCRPRGADSDVSDKGDHPVTHLGFDDCLAYCEWSGTRLPTEAEWEKAARGTDARRFAWGDAEPSPERCNFGMHVGDTTPVGLYPEAAGPHGLSDISGNVWEWTSSNYRRYPYSAGEGRIIRTRLGRVELGVIRGGSFFNDCCERGLSLATRLYTLRSYTSYDLGLRVCASDR